MQAGSLKPNRGLTRYLQSLTITNPALFTAGVSATILMKDVELHKNFPEVFASSISKSLWQLANEGVLERRNGGFYVLKQPAGTPACDTEKVVIDNLLDAMAKAEPVLHRCKRLLEALESVK